MKRTHENEGCLASDGKRRMLASSSQDSTSCDSVSLEYKDAAMLDCNPEGDIDDQEAICYGAFSGSKAKLGGTDISITQYTAWNKYIQLDLGERSSEGCFHIVFEDCGAQKQIGILDLVTSNYINLLSSLRGLSFAIILSSDDLNTLKRRAKTTKLVFEVSVNILGPAADADQAADTLLENRCFLQHPVFLSPGTKYINPQFFYSEGTKDDLRDHIGPASKFEAEALSRRFQDGLEDVLSSLAEQEQHGDGVQLPLTNSILRTKLKIHQLDAVRFILHGESEDLRHATLHDLQVSLGNGISNVVDAGVYTGGILADVMGLGKTLTMLAVIASSKNTAETYDENYFQDQRRLIPARGTLVVVTSRQILEVWRTEVESHLQPSSLSLGIFHDKHRARNPRDLSNYDVVLTTYGTLMADSRGRKVLQSIAWFRVVLDEAHWIRNSNTKQFKAARYLEATRRWCVTGTPIQNSLDDLLSLLKFLHFQPFCQQAVFERDIVSPLRSGDPNAFRNLKLLLRAICLRRNSKLLDLEPVKVEMVPVALNTEERECYKAIQINCQREFEKITSQKSELKRYTVLFSTIRQLQRLCSNGQYQAPSALVAQGKKGTTKGKGGFRTSIDIECDCCGDEEAASLLDGLSVCPECSRPLVTGKKLIADTPSTPTHLSPGSLLNTTPSRSPSPLSGDSPSSASFQATSSKLNTVADNIEQHKDDGKSLIFTSWLSTLDSLQRILESRGIPCLQIDGRVGTSEREERLQRFKQDPSVRVLLMSIQTGSVGLTLTVANRVHFVEPQWNPAVEEQAICRAHRMGQTRQVTVVRYITEKSVEETIAALQKKKSHLAKVSLDAAEHNGETTGLDDLKFVLDHDVVE